MVYCRSLKNPSCDVAVVRFESGIRGTDLAVQKAEKEGERCSLMLDLMGRF